MVKRQLEKNLIQSLDKFPVVGILGSRQVGKTTFARYIQQKMKKKSIFLDLELPSDLNKLHDPEIFLQNYHDHLVIIDEIQRMPHLFPIIRALVDQNRSPSRFLILGSASPDLINQSSESLAGRIYYHELTPFSLLEVYSNEKDSNKLWFNGGYPESFLADELGYSIKWRDGFIQTYLEKDIPQLGINIPSIQLRRFWTMLAHSQGQLWNAMQLSKGLGISAPTVKRYLDILENTYIIRQLTPYYLNIKKRLIKSPKVYIRDTGLLHKLLNILTFEQLQGHPVIGNSWEGFVIEQILSILPSGVQCHFYRTNAGAEIDLVLIINNQPIAIEIKYSLSPKLTKGFWLAYDDIVCKKGYVIYPGKESYKIDKRVEVFPLLEFVIQFEKLVFKD